MDEPSVLDLVKAKLAFWRRDPPGMPSLREAFGPRRWPSTEEEIAVTSVEPDTPGKADDHDPGKPATAAWPSSCAVSLACNISAVRAAAASDQPAMARSPDVVASAA